MKLVPEASAWWRTWSVRLGLLGSVIVSLLVAIPEWAVNIWAAFPEELKARIPPQYLPLIGVVISLLGLVSRFVQQEKVRLAVLKTELEKQRQATLDALDKADT